MNILFFIAGLVTAIFFIFTTNVLARRNRIKRKRRGSKRKNQKDAKIRIDTYCKAITTVVVSHGIIMVTTSYVLSWFGKNTVSDVSVTLITEIVAPICLYIGTNCIMNIFEKNELSFSKPLTMKQVNEKLSNLKGESGDETVDTESEEDTEVQG